MIAKVVGQKVATANRAPARGKPEFAAISELDPFPEQGIGVEGKSKRNSVQAWFLFNSKMMTTYLWNEIFGE